MTVSCHKISDQLPRAHTWRQISTSITKTRHFPSPCTGCSSCMKPVFHCAFYIYHYTLFAEHEQQTETPHSTQGINTSFSVQIRLKIELCTSIALSSASAIWAVSLLVFILWLNALEIPSQPQFRQHNLATRELRPMTLNGEAESLISTAKEIYHYFLQAQVY